MPEPKCSSKSIENVWNISFSGHNKRKGFIEKPHSRKEKKCEENPRAIPLSQVKRGET